MLPTLAEAAKPQAPSRRRGSVPRLNVLTFAGKITDTQRRVLFTPYEQLTRHAIVARAWDGTTESLQQQEKHAPGHWAAVMMEGSMLQLCCGLGLLARDDTGTAPNACGPMSAAIDYAMAWDRARFDAPPSWTDFWDVARHPGRRSLRRDPRTTLEIALLADGVPADALYRVLATSDGLNRAFMKLEQIRPYLIWWNTPNEAARILTSGGALTGFVPTGEILGAKEADRQRFNLNWNQRLLLHYGWGVPHSAAENSAGLALASWLEQPAQQQAFANAWPSLPSMRDIEASGGRLASLPPAIPVDDLFWSHNLPAIAERFAHWIDHA
ncbi:MAG: extracellular solute-binding protein [Acetobacter sp.]|uniref:extracellular solute-binding protein n=1 Tax=Acetobacter sp. TaxID=440 RepID=UPI0039EA39E4